MRQLPVRPDHRGRAGGGGTAGVWVAVSGPRGAGAVVAVVAVLTLVVTIVVLALNALSKGKRQ